MRPARAPAAKPAKAVFVSLFGSYFGDWDSESALLRAVLDRPGQAVAKERLFDLVFPGEAHLQAEAIEVVAYRLRKKLAMACAVAAAPPLMLLDEPTQGMGHEDVDRVADLIRKVAAQRTVLMVEHNLSVVEKLSDVITVLQRGQVLAEGPYSVVSQDPRVLEAYVGVEA